MKLSIILPSYNEPMCHDTLRKCKSLFPQAQVLISPDVAGKGKGWATKKGLVIADGDVIAMIDADGDIDPIMLNRLMPFLDKNDIVVGAKNYAGMSLPRKILTLLSRVYIKIMFGLDFTTQTGIKVFKKEAIPLFENNKWIFDVEMLYKAKENNFKIIEVPVEATVVRKKSIKCIFNALIDSLKIWHKLRWKKV